MIGRMWVARVSRPTILIHSRASLRSLIKWPAWTLARDVYHRTGPAYSGSQLSSKPIGAGRWQPASGLFNSPNDIRASWSALMITHSTNLHLHQHTRHRGPARAKRVRLQSALVHICMPRWTDLSMNPRTVGVLHHLKDSVIFLLHGEMPPVVEMTVYVP